MPELYLWTGWYRLRGSLRVRWEFKLQDVWIGVYWKSDRTHLKVWYDLWVCVVPCLPLHFAWEGRDG